MCFGFIPPRGVGFVLVPTGLPLAPLPVLLLLLRRRRLPTPHLPSCLLLLLLPWLLEPEVPAALYCAVPLTAPLPPPAMLDLLRPALRFGRRVRWRPMRLPRLPLPLLLPAASSLFVSPTPLVSLLLLPLRQRRAGGAPCDLRIDIHCRSSFWITGGLLPARAGRPCVANRLNGRAQAHPRQRGAARRLLLDAEGDPGYIPAQAGCSCPREH